MNQNYNDLFDDHAHCSNKSNLVIQPTEITTFSNESNDHSKNFKQNSKKQLTRMQTGKDCEGGLKRKLIDTSSPLAAKSSKVEDSVRLSKQRESSRSYRKRQNQVKEEMEQKILEKERENEGLKNIKDKGHNLLRLLVQTLVTSTNVTNPEKMINSFQNRGFNLMAQELSQIFKVQQVSTESVEIVAEQQPSEQLSEEVNQPQNQHVFQKETSNYIIIDETMVEPSNQFQQQPQPEPQQQPAIISYIIEQEYSETDLNIFQEIFDTKPEEMQSDPEPTQNCQSSFDYYLNDGAENIENMVDINFLEKMLE